MSKARLLIALLPALLMGLQCGARTINIHGKVTQQNNGEPLGGAMIFSTAADKLIGYTDADGNYLVTADSEDELQFTAMGSQPVREGINGRLEINVALAPDIQALQEIVVETKMKLRTMDVEETDLDVKGNTLGFKTRVKIPDRLFGVGKRVIVQPAVYNVTRQTVTYASPRVFEGKEYATTQKRMYDWDIDKDPLTPWTTTVTPERGGNSFHIVDSLKVDDPTEDFMCIVFTSLENYNRIIYADTFEIARGTVNPMRFLQYSLEPVPVTDEAYFPTPEMELRDAEGDINLLFPLGKSALDLNMGNNAAEITRLTDEVTAIAQSPDMTLKSFAIIGSASPEGTLQRNRQLADERMTSALEAIMSRIDPGLRRGAETSTKADVATWADVEKLLRADGRTDEADAVANIISSTSRPEEQERLIRRLRFYNLIKDEYLPRLRRVRYSMVWSCYRPLTDQEIADLYAANPLGLSKYQYHKLYDSTTDPARREQIIRHAVQRYPDFVVAATDLADIMLGRGEAEQSVELLEPYFVDPVASAKLPEATRYDMGLALMGTRSYSRADSILSYIPDTPVTHKTKVYAAAMNGRTDDVMVEVSQDSPLNEVVLLLAKKNNDLAYMRSQRLGTTAVEEYVKAVAANRTDNYLEATEHLRNAIALDPTLADVAKVDGDVIDILEYLNDEDEY